MINKSIQNRRSVRAYNDQPVARELIEEIIKAAQFSPSAINNRAWEFVVLEDQVDKDKIFVALGAKHEFIKNAPVIIIPLMSNAKSVLPVQDLSIAIMCMFIQITELGLGSVWKNVVAPEAEAIKTAFDIPKDFTLLAVLPIGYPAQELPAHTDAEFDVTKIHWHKF